MSELAQRFTVGRDFSPGKNDKGCDKCRQPFSSGQRVFMLVHNATPWRSVDEDTEWAGYCWHVTCDEGSEAAGPG